MGICGLIMLNERLFDECWNGLTLISAGLLARALQRDIRAHNKTVDVATLWPPGPTRQNLHVQSD